VRPAELEAAAAERTVGTAGDRHGDDNRAENLAAAASEPRAVTEHNRSDRAAQRSAGWRLAGAELRAAVRLSVRALIMMSFVSPTSFATANVCGSTHLDLGPQLAVIGGGGGHGGSAAASAAGGWRHRRLPLLSQLRLHSYAAASSVRVRLCVEWRVARVATTAVWRCGSQWRQG